MEDQDRAARRARVRLVAIGGLALALLVGGGVLLTNAVSGQGASAAPSGERRSSTPHPTPSASSRGKMTPAKAKPMHLLKPESGKDGFSVGFPRTGPGAVSAAVYYLEESPFLDDVRTRQQLSAVTSRGSSAYIDKQVSEVRKVREAAGLAPSGGVPGGLTFTTNVNAIRATPLVNRRLVQVWLNYDRYATKPDGTPANEPIKDETTDLLLIWEDGDWKITDEPRYRKLRTFPASYDPDSPISWQSGWWQVAHVA
ncbi:MULTISPECIES: hypothetical protein [Streptomyces]|uniref:Integral membrane protein n=1 Tax=Streptomyces lonegramiae TaxID=3075524 RepID=A0ABU2XDI0_9ACTN|nr:hypothetical protein [Streptomyces sp. DSM 41529]MDT0543969.1 hypothetical protein [Streptomyces sp. DSM 41529]